MSEAVGKGEERRDALKLLLGRICCVVGLLFGAGDILFAACPAGPWGRRWASLAISSARRRLGATTVVLGVVAVFFVAAASAGLIPGVTPLQRVAEGQSFCNPRWSACQHFSISAIWLLTC